MRVDRVTVVLGILAAAVNGGAGAQSSAQLAGVWERVSQSDSAGNSVQPPNPRAFAIYAANGHYSQIAIPTGRPKFGKPLAELTKEEHFARSQRVTAHRGTYSTSRNTLTRKMISHTDATSEGLDLVQQFRIVGDTLVLSAPNPASKAGARFVRVR